MWESLFKKEDNMQKPILIIGTGLAGYNLAKEIRKLDPIVPLCLITQDDGCFYSKPQLSSSLGHQKSPDDLMLSDVTKMREQLQAEIHTYTDVTAVDPVAHCVKAGDKIFPYGKLIFANGAKVLPVIFSGSAANEVIRVNNLEDYRRFYAALSGKKTVAIIGAGLVGTEFAIDLTSVGFTVHVVAMSQTPLDRFMLPACGEVVKHALSERGIHWHLNKTIQSIDHHSSGYVLDCGDEKIVADLVLVAIGITPDIALAQTAGLKVNKGIVVDDCCQSSDEDIYALGDCAEIVGVVRNYTVPILQAAKSLAKTLTGTRTPISFPIMPIIVKSPAYPIVMVLPSANQVGEWHVEIADKVGSKALFILNDQVFGFVLTGQYTSERMELIKILKQ